MQIAYSETRSAHASDKQACSSVQGIVVFGIDPYATMQGGGGGHGHGVDTVPGESLAEAGRAVAVRKGNVSAL